MKLGKVYDSIFDAFRVFAPSSPLIQLEDKTAYFFNRTNRYEIVDIGGYRAMFPEFPRYLYRGECMVHDTCKASIYRSKDPDDRVINELRIIEFTNIIKTFPQVKYAIEDGTRVDFLALAQHYALDTNLVDLASSPEVAAYFATHKWVNGKPVPVDSGIGCIRGFSCYAFRDNNNSEFMFIPKFHMIGLQCFERPGRQTAFGMELDEDEDLNEYIGWKAYFKQSKKASNLIHFNFHRNDTMIQRLRKSETKGPVKSRDLLEENGMLFPKEEIADIAKLIKETKSFSKHTIEEYGKACEDILKKKGYAISETPLYVLSDAHRKELENEYKDKPYGDVRLYANWVLVPPVETIEE